MNIPWKVIEGNEDEASVVDSAGESVIVHGWHGYDCVAPEREQLQKIVVAVNAIYAAGDAIRAGKSAGELAAIVLEAEILMGRHND